MTVIGCAIAKITKRPFDSVAMSDEMKQFLRKEITHFKDNRDWYLDKGLPHKLTFMLEGIPGTGKTSMIKAIASEFGMNLCVINITHVSDTSIEAGFASVPDNSIVVIEDFDSSKITKSREVTQITKEKDSTSEESMPTGLSLTGLLNALDGVNPLDNCLVFLTTNHKEQIDPAIYRKGRVDHSLYIGKVNGMDIRRYSERTYPDHDFSTVEFNEGLGCHLNEALLYGKENPYKYVQSLVENGIVVEQQTNINEENDVLTFDERNIDER
jgi:chaperone BCS1